MKPRLFSIVLLPLGVALSPIASGADASDASPYDANPACMERTTDASTGACVPQVEGTPRQTYPSRAPGAAPKAGGVIGAPGTTGASSGSSAAPAGPRDRGGAASSGK